MHDRPQVSIVIPTYNRSTLLRNAVESVLRQDTQWPFEIVIVNNNSNDDTEAVAQDLINKHPDKVTYVVESKQGNSYARNSGVKAAQADIIAFIDDDVTVENNWLQSCMEVLTSHEELSFVGGSVLPEWNGSPPAWVTPDHWAPLALLDYGPNEFCINGNNPLCLLTANIAFRRTVFDQLGMFSPDLQRVNDSIGSMEDHEFLLRVCRSGKQGMYLPGMVAKAPVDLARLTKEYHRRWHTGHGHFYALLRDAEWERSKFYLSGVPSHLYKQTAIDALRWLGRMLTANTAAAFAAECRLRFFYGFYRQRTRGS
ncbi:MAG TPA: glycosyltransferase family 2 protein [Pyrinomonadaceae bacterium]